MNSHSKLILAVATFCAARFAFALSPGETVDNFRLPDHQGGSRELYYLSDMKAVVLMAQGNGCEASRQAVPGLKTLRDQYRSQGVEVLLIDSNLNDTSAAIAKAATDQGIDMPILIDDTQLIGEALDLRRNGEVLVINPQGWKLAYRGPVANAGDAVNAIVNGEPVKTAKVETKGCAITHAGARQETGAREDLLRQVDRADADRQLRRVSSQRRHRPVADVELRHDQRLRADDPRSRAHRSACRRGTPTRTTRRSRTTARCRRTRSRRSCTGSKPARRAAAAAIRWSS